MIQTAFYGIGRGKVMHGCYGCDSLSVLYFKKSDEKIVARHVKKKCVLNQGHSIATGWWISKFFWNVLKVEII